MTPLLHAALVVSFTALGTTESVEVPVGSGTIVSKTGIILTNAHVVDFGAFRDEIESLMDHPEFRGMPVNFDLTTDHVIILGSDGGQPAEPLYLARIVETDASVDLAVLQIVAHADGQTLDPSELELVHVPLGNSANVELGDPIDIFGYPAATGTALTYTSGVVSGFTFEAGSADPAWINTDATISGGSSGGTAVNRQGELIGIPTQSAELDCRPGDTNRDGEIDARDVGCIPVGGSIGQLRPIEQTRPLLEDAGFHESLSEPESAIPDSALATIKAYSTREAGLEESLTMSQATISALSTEQSISGASLEKLSREAARAAARATEDAISAQATIDELGIQAAARSTEIANLESQQAFARGATGPLATAQAESAVRATEITELRVRQADAQVTATALAAVATNSVLNPNQESLTIQTDLNGILTNDEEALEAARAALSTQLSRYPIDCRAGFMLISGSAPSIEQGIELAESAESMLREFWPDIFTEATGAEQFALPGVQPFGEVNVDIFFYSGCEPIG